MIPGSSNGVVAIADRRTDTRHPSLDDEDVHYERFNQNPFGRG